MSDNDAKVSEFLREPVPPGGTAMFEQWKERCRSLGGNGVPIFIRALKMGTEEEQYVALLALRLHGFEAWGSGDGEETEYRVRQIGEKDWTIIVPQYPPRDFGAIYNAIKNGSAFDK